MWRQLTWVRRGCGAGLLGCALLALAGSAEAEAKPPAALERSAALELPSPKLPRQGEVDAPGEPCAAGEPGCDPAPLNVICNDGTESPTCEVCRRGCCSHHGGCR